MFDQSMQASIASKGTSKKKRINLPPSQCISHLPQQRCCPEIETLVEKMGEDSALAIIAYTCEDPYPLHKWLNAWLCERKKDLTVRENVGPFFRLFYQGLEKLPRHNKQAFQQIQVGCLFFLKLLLDFILRQSVIVLLSTSRYSQRFPFFKMFMIIHHNTDLRWRFGELYLSKRVIVWR